MGLPANTWWGVGKASSDGRFPFTTTGFLVKLGRGWKNNYYPFGCRGDSRHHGVDIGNEKGMPIYAWGDCIVTLSDYDKGGYHRYIQVYFPSIGYSLTLGHLLNGSQPRVGARIKKGQRIARVGTKKDGINHPHVHFRAAKGNWGKRSITPCGDINPLIVWKKLGLPV